MMRIARVAVALLLTVLMAPALAVDVRKEVVFPDVPGYETLVCDLHMHTVFSDGSVWPSVRVKEAWRQGLDVLAITEHIEHQPHKDDVSTDHNRSYELAKGDADAHNVLLIRGAEISRDTPPGHFNALFLQNVNPLDAPDFLEVVKRANEQGAFLFWNHQEWQGAERGRWRDVHTNMYENGWLHGMEVCNGEHYYPDAHRWCLDKNLTMLGNSDLHDPDLRSESAADDHRTMTLVFATERSAAAVKEALQAGRTAVWFEGKIIGRREHLEPLLAASVRIDPPHRRAGNKIWMAVHNIGAAPIRVERTGKIGPREFSLPARSTSLVKLTVRRPDAPIDLKYTVTNFLIAPDTGLPVEVQVPQF